MFHGTDNEALPVHEGLCLTPREDAAEDYARNAAGYDGRLHEVSLDLDGLTVLEAAGYDRDANRACGDGTEAYGADVLVFTDESPKGREHLTYRLMTAAALAAVTVITTSITDW